MIAFTACGRGRSYRTDYGGNLAVMDADQCVEGLLLGPDGELPIAAVESITWGRINATFVR